MTPFFSFIRNNPGRSLLLAIMILFPPLFAEETSPPSSTENPLVLMVDLEGAISPATSDRLLRAIERAEQEEAEALLVRLDTHGGLMSSMDDMIRAILSSRVPVIMYVGPAGASCGSAGVYLLYASHLAAMAPATNLGSATPISMSPGGGNAPAGQGQEEIPKEAGADDGVNMKRKILHHALAQIDSLAEYRGRDPEFARKAVLEAENITSTDALKRKVINFIAATPEEVLAKASGMKVRMLTETRRLSLENYRIIHEKEDNRFRFLSVLSDPNIAYIFMMIGVLGILAEIQYPGSIFPGIVGSISLLLGLYAMQTISVNYAGMGLVLLGVLFLLLEIFTVSFGFFTTAGVVSMVIGSIMLFPGDGALFSATAMLAAGSALATGLLVGIILWKASKTLRSPVRSRGGFSRDEIGIVRSTVSPTEGSVFIAGEIWNARTKEESIPEGSSVRIVERKNMVLIVEAIQKDQD